MRNRIKELRKAQQLTLEALAKRVDTSNQHISHLENGNRRLTIEWVERLADALSCHPLELLDDRTIVKTPQEEMILSLFRNLSDEQQEAIINAAVSIFGTNR